MSHSLCGDIGHAFSNSEIEWKSSDLRIFNNCGLTELTDYIVVLQITLITDYTYRLLTTSVRLTGYTNLWSYRLHYVNTDLINFRKKRKLDVLGHTQSDNQLDFGTLELWNFRT